MIKFKVVRIVLGDVGNAFTSFSQEPFQKKVVDCGSGVVSIVYYLSLSLLLIDLLIFGNLFDDTQIDWNWVFAYVNTQVLSDIDLLVPRMGSDFFKS